MGGADTRAEGAEEAGAGPAAAGLLLRAAGKPSSSRCAVARAVALRAVVSSALPIEPWLAFPPVRRPNVRYNRSGSFRGSGSVQRLGNWHQGVPRVVAHSGVSERSVTEARR